MDFPNDILAGGGIAVALLTLIEIAPIRVNPWSAVLNLFRKGLSCLGDHMNSGVMKELAEVKTKLDGHIEADGRRAANEVRAQILRFNNELLRDIHHTKEEYIDILSDIDAYENYCEGHPDYPNNRAILAIETIKANYKERLQKHDFLESFGGGDHA